jgi:hypothetical protein
MLAGADGADQAGIGNPFGPCGVTSGAQQTSRGEGQRKGFRNSGSELSLDAGVTIKPSPQLDISVSPRVGKQTVTDQYVLSTSTLSYAPTYGRRYLFGELERRTLSMETRIDWTFSPTLFLVWQRRQAGRVGVGDFDLRRDVDALLRAPSDDHFMIKVNYWLGL